MSSFDKILERVREIYPKAKIVELVTAMDNTIEWVEVSKDFYIGREKGKLYLSLWDNYIYTNIDHMLRILTAIKNKKEKVDKRILRLDLKSYEGE